MRRFFLSLLLLIPCIAIAQDAVDRLILKDGSSREGYIKIQHVDKDFVFVSQKTTATIKGATISRKQKYDLDKLPKRWKQWVKENPNVSSKNENAFFLSDILFNMAKQTDLQEVYVLEEGDEIKYIDLAEREETIPLDEIQSVERIPVPDSVISKTIDLIVKNDGDSIKGQIISQDSEERVKIRQGNGITKVVKFSDILFEEKVKECSGLSFWEQSKYLEIVRTTSKGKEFEGVITKRYYGNDSEEGYLLVTDKDDKPHTVPMKDVTEIQKSPNKGYKEKVRLNVEGDSVYVNQTLAKWYQAEISSFFIFKRIEVKGDSEIVKIKNSEESSEISVEITMKNTKENQDCILLKPEKKTKNYHFSFSYETIVNDAIPPKPLEEKLKVDEPLRRIYTLRKGEYVLFRRSDNKCVILKIE